MRGAATIHKGQGVTVDHTYVLASEYLDRHASYVAMTRHQNHAELFWSRETFTQYEDLVAALSRERIKDSTLDYSPIEFSDQRGITSDDHIPLFSPYPDANHDSKDDNLLDWKTLWQEFSEKHIDDINHIEQIELSTLSSEQNNFSDLFIGLNGDENDSLVKLIDKDKDIDEIEI